MKIIQFENQKGFAASDGLIAVLIIALFAGLIATISYNIYLSNSSIKRMSKATSYIVDMFEYIDKINYDEITKENLIKYFNDKYYYNEDGTTPKTDAEVKLIEEGEDIDTPFKAKISVEKYNQTEGNTEKLDLVQEITMTVTYKLGNKEQKIEIKRNKSRERLISPNKPDLSLLTVAEGEKVYPIKEMNGNYVVCNQNDSNWYNYQNNKEAKAIVTTSELKVGDTVSKTDITIYKWIPRYAENSDGDIKYLYSNTTNKYVGEQEEYEKLLDLEEGYTVNTDYFGDATGIWELI